MIIDPKMFVIADLINKEIKGRAADQGRSLPYIGQMVLDAGPGDHLEIGTLFGASAIMAALVKEQFNLAGNVVCIDPFKPRDNIKMAPGSDLSKRDGSIEAVVENANHFKVAHKLVIFPQPSYPWPTDLKDAIFETAYIDGDHVGLAPWLDFVNLRDRTKKYIAFDNFEEQYPDVMMAAIRACSIGFWILHYKTDIFCCLRRPAADRVKQWEENNKAVPREKRASTKENKVQIRQGN